MSTRIRALRDEARALAQFLEKIVELQEYEHIRCPEGSAVTLANILQELKEVLLETWFPLTYLPAMTNNVMRLVIPRWNHLEFLPVSDALHAEITGDEIFSYIPATPSLIEEMHRFREAYRAEKRSPVRSPHGPCRAPRDRLYVEFMAAVRAQFEAAGILA
jgi:hypothetical protein